ncbi:MAG: TIGR00159 family protein, partial [Oceanihabitans sp.]
MEIFDDLLKFTAIDFIDVVLVALLLYYVYKLVKGTVAINIFIGIVIIYIIWKITQAL